MGSGVGRVVVRMDCKRLVSVLDPISGWMSIG